MNTTFALALDTSSPVCAVAVLALDAHGERVGLATRMSHAPNAHSSVLLPFVHRCCDELGAAPGTIGSIAAGVGPGSFTGIRIGVATAQGLAMGWGCPVHPMDSLMILAEQAHAMTGATDIVVALDARMQSAYAARYRLDETLGQWTITAPASQIAYAAWPSHLTGAQIGIGDAFALHPGLGATVEHTAGPAEPCCLAMARLVERLLRAGGATHARTLHPNYVRDKVAATIAERSLVTP